MQLLHGWDHGLEERKSGHKINDSVTKTAILENKYIHGHKTWRSNYSTCIYATLQEQYMYVHRRYGNYMYMYMYLHGWGVHKVKGQKVIDAHRLERENSLREVGPLDLRNGRG